MYFTQQPWILKDQKVANEYGCNKPTQYLAQNKHHQKVRIKKSTYIIMKSLDKLIQSKRPKPKNVCKSDQEPPNLKSIKFISKLTKDPKKKKKELHRIFSTHTHRAQNVQSKCLVSSTRNYFRNLACSSRM